MLAILLLMIIMIFEVELDFIMGLWVFYILIVVLPKFWKS